LHLINRQVISDIPNHYLNRTKVVPAITALQHNALWIQQIVPKFTYLLVSLMRYSTGVRHVCFYFESRSCLWSFNL